MLKLTHGRPARLTGAALAAMIAAAGLAATAQVQAKPEAAQPKVERVEFRKIVKDGKVVEQTGMPADFRAKLADCEGEKFEAEADAPPAGGHKQRNKVFICLKKGTSSADTVTMLEDAVKRIESEDDIRGGKEQLLAQIRARIAELRR